ncbi:MAG: hypothetical protein NC489_24905 [Ruminococcus flavefaciens]|nr:hypothetical protein [Ruminococcus flavefaciens]
MADKEYYEQMFSVYVDKKTRKSQQVKVYGQSVRRLNVHYVTTEPLVVDIDTKQTFKVVEKTIKVLEPTN